MINFIKTVVVLVVSIFANIIKGIGNIFNNIGFTLVEGIGYGENQGPTAPAEEVPSIFESYFDWWNKHFG